MDTRTTDKHEANSKDVEALSGLRQYFTSVGKFSRNARLYLAGAFLIGLNHQVFQLLFNLYLKEINFGEGQIGSIASSRAVGMTIAAIPIAWLISRMRVKPMLLIGSVLFTLFGVALVRFSDMFLLISFGTMSGMAFSIFRVASGPFFMRNSGPEERTHLFSFSFAVMLFAGMIGSLGAGRLVSFIETTTGDMILGYQYTLYLAIAAGLCSLIPFSMIRSTKPTGNDRKINISFARLRKRGGFYFRICLANILIGSGAGLIIPFLPLYFQDRFDLQPEAIANFYLFSLMAMAIGVLLGPLISKRLGLIRTVVLTQLLSIPFMITLSYTSLLPLAVIAFILRAGFMNLGVPIATNFAMEMSEQEEQGFVNALLGISWTGGWAVSAIIGGRLIETHGYSLTLDVAVGLYIASAIVYFIMFRRAEKRHHESGLWYVPQVERV